MKKIKKLILFGLIAFLLLFAGAWFFVNDFDLWLGGKYRKYITGNTYPVPSFSATQFGDRVFLTWAIPNDERFDHSEIYYSGSEKPTIGSPKIELPDVNSTYTWFDIPQNTQSLLFACYTVDRNAQHSTPMYASIELNKENNPQPSGIMRHYYDELKFLMNAPFYILENDYLKCYFSNGALYALENKRSSLQPEYNVYGNENSFISAMDVGEKIPGSTITRAIFGLYSEYDIKDSTWITASMDSNSISFQRHFWGGKTAATIRYTLDSNAVNVELRPENGSDFGIRFNTTGNSNYKVVNQWTAEKISAIVEEEKYGKNSAVNEYKHSESIFNDHYPYLETRRFLMLGDSSVFSLYHDNTRLFVLDHINGNRDFFYKNCSGEESFSFGVKPPYEQYISSIRSPFSFRIKVVY